MLLRLLKTGLLAGFLAALVYTAVQAVTVTPLILEAETYEHGKATAHAHIADANRPVFVHDHETIGGADAWAPADGLERTFYTFLSNLVLGVGFGCALAAAIALRGEPVDARRGVLWGLAGFAVFVVAPALGLPPEVPGAATADLAARQTWWAATAFATAAGLALIVLTRHPALRALGAVAIVVPHLVGAPEPAGGHGSVPPELAAHFVVWTLATAALFWAVLGAACGELWRRFA